MGRRPKYRRILGDVLTVVLFCAAIYTATYNAWVHFTADVMTDEYVTQHSSVSRR